MLAKLMFAERFLSSLFDQIATVAVTDSKEHCADLAMLEKVDTPESSKSPAKTKQADATEANSGAVQAKSESALLAEWKSSDAILAWARVLPSVADIDLRP